MVEPLDLESRIWSERGTKPAPGDEVYQPGFQPIAGFDNWQNWAVTTDLHNLRDQVGSLDDVYYRQSIADGLFYARHEADDRFLDVDGDTATGEGDYFMNGASFGGVNRVGGDDLNYGVSFEDASGPGLYLSDRTLPAGERAVFAFPGEPNEGALTEDAVLFGNPNVPYVYLRSDLAGVNDLRMADGGGGVRFLDPAGDTKAVLSGNGDLSIAGTVSENTTF